MKGLALPIEMIVIVAVALIVLIVVAAFFASQFGGGASTIEKAHLKSQLCSTLLTAYNCDPNQVENIEINGTTLWQLCYDEGIKTKEACAASCPGCT